MSSRNYLEDMALWLDKLVYTNDIEGVKRFLARGLDPNAVDAYLNPIYTAVRLNRMECLALLLAAGANPNERSCIGSSMLHEAVIRKSPEMVLLLLDYGADYGCILDCMSEVHGEVKVTPLQLAEFGSPECFEAMNTWIIQKRQRELDDVAGMRTEKMDLTFL